MAAALENIINHNVVSVPASGSGIYADVSLNRLLAPNA